MKGIKILALSKNFVVYYSDSYVFEAWTWMYRERDFYFSWTFLVVKWSQTVENAHGNVQERWTVVTMNGQERLGTNRENVHTSKTKDSL